jgi:hypothetical protein
VFLCALAWLTACAPERVVVRTKLVEVPVLVPVPVDRSLTAPTPGPDVPQRPLYCDDLERLAHGYQASLGSCNADKAAIEAGSGPASKAAKPVARERK